jgi:basic membrane lipoprotein Med (substrate-binding protein (PBP1-ABC) superfamily)/DNA-binding SARP family transcriptional activator
MHFRVLGALEAGSGEAVAQLGPPKQRALLAVLLMHVGQIVPTERLIDLLWGEAAPRTAAHSIQIYVSELRRALEPLAGRQLIITRQPGYLLDVPREAIDALNFEQLVADGLKELEAGDSQAAVGSLRAALKLWRGPALSDFTYEEFAQPYIRRFHDVHLDAVEALAAAELEVNRPTDALSLLEAAIREDPLRERSRELLMLALYRTGRHAEALRTFERLRELLGDELGLEPSPSLRRLRDQILLHDPTLLPVQWAAPVARTERNPYKGLRPFGEDDADDFFGRDALVGRMLEAVAAGTPVVSLVGPSGSGKSSAIAAGLLARLRSGALKGSKDWLIARLVPGTDPLREAGALLEQLGAAARGGRRAVLVIDQFEQLFVVADEAARRAFLDALSAAVKPPTNGPQVFLTLRADFYDRPLQHAGFAEIFAPGVVHVLPMSASELEAAIVEPAERVGITVEPPLLAELIAETADRPGSLPLLQYTMTELFEQRSGSRLTLDGYRRLGGLRGVLSRRAESLYASLGADEQRVATQAFLRLLRPGRGAADSRRRVALSELTGLGVDTVALSEVLTAFGRHRLLTFDRDPLSGEATVEVAHEALLSEWERLAGWIERYRVALRRREALVAAVEEWDLAGRHPDYLPTGSRLDEFSALGAEGGLQLTERERKFLETALARRDAERAREAERTAAQRRLERSAKLRLIALGLAIVLLSAALAYGVLAGAGAPPPQVVAIWPNEDGLFDRLFLAGSDRAAREFGVQSSKFSFASLLEATETELGRPLTDESIESPEAQAAFFRAQETELRRVSSNFDLVIVYGVQEGDFDPVVRDYPGTHYAFLNQSSMRPNVAHLSVAEHEGTYLAGAAAALRSETGIIGFVGGWDFPVIWRFEAGFTAGARAVRPDIEVLVDYIQHFGDESLGEATALGMYQQGADVIIHAAGNAGLGVFEAAMAVSREQDRQRWAIGVDTDQYATVLQLPGAVNARSWQSHILTSVVKHIDRLAYTLVADFAQGTFTSGSWNWGLAEGGVDISYSGGYIDDLRPTLENLKTRIVAGEIVVPCVPDSKRDEAALQGIDPDACR